MAREYNFVLGEINDELVEEYRGLLLEYGKKLKNSNLIGYKVANGKLELTDEILFQSAICFAKEHLKEVLNSDKVNDYPELFTEQYLN